MDDALSTGAVFLLIVVLIIIHPVYQNFEYTEKTINNYVNVTTSRFQKEVRDNGYVDYYTYIKFRQSLLNTKKIYDVEMIHERKDIFPESENSSNNYFVESNKQILNTIENKQKYKMNYGDNFTVIVKEKGISEYKFLNMFLYGNTSSSKYIFAKYGGMVENEE